MEAENVVITIADVTGRECLVSRLATAGAPETELDITPLVSGIYLLKIQTGYNTRIIRIVKQ
jgi:hypothetical protein